MRQDIRDLIQDLSHSMAIQGDLLQQYIKPDSQDIQRASNASQMYNMLYYVIRRLESILEKAV